MNFAALLAMDVKPLPGTLGRGRTTWKRDTKTASKAVQNKAIQKYVLATGKEWSKTVDISVRLGMERTSIFKQLVKYHSLGILERRPFGGKTYSHYRGWEWRVK